MCAVNKNKTADTIQVRPGNLLLRFLSQWTDDGANILISWRYLPVANEEQLEHSLQSVTLTIEPKTPIVASSAVVSCQRSKSVNLSALLRKAEGLFC